MHRECSSSPAASPSSALHLTHSLSLCSSIPEASGAVRFCTEWTGGHPIICHAEGQGMYKRRQPISQERSVIGPQHSENCTHIGWRTLYKHKS